MPVERQTIHIDDYPPPTTSPVPVVDERRLPPPPAGAPKAPEKVSVVSTRPAEVAAVRTATTRRFTPDALIAAAVGVALLLFGLVAVTRAGLDGPWSSPVVRVLGFTHTASLGVVEIAIGACLLAAGATCSQSGALFCGSVLAIASFVGAVQTASFRHSLALESGFAWLGVIGGSVVVASSLLLPRFSTRTTVVTTR